VNIKLNILEPKDQTIAYKALKDVTVIHLIDATIFHLIYEALAEKNLHVLNWLTGCIDSPG
jgi:hypothetical protein